jgi:hypothetical protein
VTAIVLTILAGIVAGIATNIITDRWKVPGSGRAVASFAVMLIIVALGIGTAQHWVHFIIPPKSPTPTTVPPPSTGSSPPSSGPVSPTPTPSHPSPSPTRTTPPAPTDDETTTPPEPVPKIVKFWSGTFRLHQVTGVELDTKPASSATGPAGNLDASDLMYDNREARGNLLHAAGGPLAQWSGNNRPDATGCIEAVQTDTVSVVAPQVGQVLCVGTSGGRVARLEVLEAGYESVRFSVTVWADGS